MPDSLRVYVDRLRSLANRLIADRFLTPPELIELNACLMLVAIAQKLGDCEPDLFDQHWMAQVKQALVEMRDDVSAPSDPIKKEQLRWN